MIDGREMKRKPGAVAVLALLVSFLLAVPPAAQANPAGRAQLGSAEQVKHAAPLRTSIRSQSDDRDGDSVLLPPAPAIVTESVCARPATPFCSTGWSSGPRPSLTAYRARAPPAF